METNKSSSEAKEQISSMYPFLNVCDLLLVLFHPADPDFLEIQAHPEDLDHLGFHRPL